jgi:hypothetical protein
VRRPFEQRIKIGVVSGLGIGAEYRGVDIDVYVGPNIGQAAPAFALHGSMHVPAPQILPTTGGLQLPCYRYRPGQGQIEALEGGIIGPKLTNRSYRTPLKVPNVNPQHSRLK